MGPIHDKKIFNQTPLRKTTGNDPAKRPKAESQKTSAPVDNQSESVVLTKVEIPGTEPTVKEIKTARPGSDMANMVDSLQENGVLKHSPVDSKQQTKAAVESDVQNIEAIVGSTGTIALLEETPTGSDVGNVGKAHGSGHTHDALLAKHLGTEVVEQVGHKAHYAASHVQGGLSAASGKGNVVGELASQKGQTLGEALDLATQKGVHGADTAANLAASKADNLGHAAEIAVQKGTHGLTEAAHLSPMMETALKIGAPAAFGLSLPLLYIGAKETIHGGKEALKAHKELKEAKTAGDEEAIKALKEERGEGVATLTEGIGTSAVAVRSAAAGAVMWEMVSSSSTVAEVASVAYKTLKPLGLLHAGIDVALGVRDMVKGRKATKKAKAEGDEVAKKAGQNKFVQGALKTAFGVAVGFAAAGAGVPATLTAIGLLAVKTVHKHVSKKRAKKAAEQAQNQESPKVETPRKEADPTRGSP